MTRIAREFRRRACSFGLLPLLFCLSLPFAERASATEPIQHLISFGGGAFTSFEGSHRSIFGTGADLSAEYAVSLAAPGTWLVLECGWLRASGRTLPDDPVFETDEASYTAFPFGVGLRVTGVSDHPVRVGFGVTGEWLYARLSGPFGDEESQSGVAVAIDIRPEIRLSHGWGLWFRERLRISSDFVFEEIDGQLIEFQGATFSAGLTARFGAGAETQR